MWRWPPSSPQVPGLVKDGLEYSHEQATVLLAFAKEKYRGAPAGSTPIVPCYLWLAQAALVPT